MVSARSPPHAKRAIATRTVVRVEQEENPIKAAIALAIVLGVLSALGGMLYTWIAVILMSIETSRL